MEKQRMEIVERKGIGHPDSIADGLAESVSRALCKRYIEEFGYIMHHNTDEGQIVGGQSEPRFGGGVILEPVYILLVGRATSIINGKRFPIRSISVKAAHEYLDKNFPNLDADTDVILDCKTWQGSQELKTVYDSRRRLANDTSIGVGYAPLSETEKITLEMEKYLNGKLKKKYPEIGEDVKVMSCRNDDEIRITVAVAMVDKYIPDADHYINVKEELVDLLEDYSSNFTDRKVSIEINTADDYEKKVYYLTVTGLSMENGDDGSVGRGNRVNGLITPNRPMSLEAAAGKNPVTHVGKLYNIIANFIANDIVKECGVEEAHVRILSQIGKPIDHPLAVDVQLIFDGNLNKLDEDVKGIVNERLGNIGKIKDMILEEKIKMF
jgi:S-adenosylmethionine synthetase